MKKTYLIICLLALTAGLGCKKAKSVADIEEEIPYHMETPTTSLTIDTTIFKPTFPLIFPMPAYPIPTLSKQIIAQYNTSANKLNSVRLTQMAMTLAQPATGNFNFLSAVNVSITAGSLPMIRVAYNNAVPRNTKTVTLTDTTGDLKAYFLQDTINVYITGTFIDYPPDSAVVDVNCSFHMSANPLN